MPEEVVYYVTKYGYLAIFILVFLQETGMPNPFPNELLLMFSGYLSFKGFFSLPFVILSAVCADFVGTNILYFLFYYTGTVLLKKRPKWFPLSETIIDRITSKISRGGKARIYFLRITPFTRGYASVITGLLQIKPKVFLPIALISAITWASVYVVFGHLIGPSWDFFISHIGSFKYFLLAILALALSINLITNFFKSSGLNKGKGNNDNSGMS